jgi:polyvinyl alcohol dehydrogenase (cytochrome)
VRAYSTSDGSPLWDFDTGRSFRAVNGIDATGGQVNGWPVVVVDGAVYVVSGASTQAKPGNALLVFSVDGR